MHQKNYFFSSKKLTCYFNTDFSYLEELVSKDNVVMITDENIILRHPDKFSGLKTIIIKPGEQNKNQNTFDYIIKELISIKADRETFIIGVGGGVVTDIAGYAASVFMRGVKFGFVPTTILAMVDAAVGGKNGIDVGLYKNLIGTTRQPEFLLFDYAFLQTLPDSQWINGFAEIIKHACIKDKNLFEHLENNSLAFFQSSKDNIDALVKRNVELKCNVVSNDEFETGERKLLNFGHTLGHAVENKYELPHGNAVSIGMVAACNISEKINGFDSTEKDRVISLLKKYHLPVDLKFDRDKVWEVLLMDKKKSGDTMNFILLNAIGEGIVKPISLHQLKDLVDLCL
ncbi:MAG: 3-dehydroquinate synthase [Chitinophagaceae bacterium]|nr:3-dehydroquinate synthase [Chitinophagaceae bacterium]